jgi:hypothetical protein
MTGSSPDRGEFMTRPCRKCRRINPPNAVYCYFDGFALDDQHQNRRTVQPGTQAFPMAFTFPSGRTCRNFNELALACQDEWTDALSMLQSGHLERFLGGLGRIDLARAAQDAAHFPDPHRGLDQLLGRFPGDILAAAKLVVKQSIIHLGPLEVGCDRRFVVTLTNAGARLVHGSIGLTAAPWLFFSEAPNALDKLFQFHDRADITLEVAGQRLRAGLKPLESSISIESSGGRATITVLADVPPIPFPSGPLQGALTPRQLAEKARTAPKKAGAFFENGAVANWYRSNGWIYPVQGPTAAGRAGVQQFFEALRLTRPPLVTVSPAAVQLTGRPGERVGCILTAETVEDRPVFAWANSDRLWLTVGTPELKGRFARLLLLVPSIPDSPGQTLTARVTVQTNGNQRFIVPVTLVIKGVRSGSHAQAPDEESIPTVLPVDWDELPTVLPTDDPPQES